MSTKEIGGHDGKRDGRIAGAELKAEVLAQCNAPCASVAKVSMSHGINANVVHHWRQLAREGRTKVTPPRDEFVLVPRQCGR